MSNADSVSAAFGLLLGLVVHQNPMAVAADAGPSGPVVAIEKARAAASSESRRAHESDAQATQVFAPGASAAPAAPVAAAIAAPGAAVAPSRLATDAAQTAADTAPSADADADADAARAPVAVGGVDKYDPTRHRDPFRPPNLTSVAGDKSAPRTPLEAYEIGQLRLVGIVQDAGKARAMVEDSAGLGYIVTTGTPIGSSGGVVHSIEPRRLLIQETTTNFYGEKQAKEVVMELPQEDRSP